MNTSTSNLTNSQPLNGYFSFCHPRGYRDEVCKWTKAKDEVGPPGKLTGAGNRKVDRVTRSLVHHPDQLLWLLETARCATYTRERDDFAEAVLTRKKLPGQSDDAKRRSLQALERLGQLVILETSREGTRVKMLQDDESRIIFGSVQEVHGETRQFTKVHPSDTVKWNTMLEHPEALRLIWWLHYSHNYNTHLGVREVPYSERRGFTDWHTGLTRREARKGMEFLLEHGMVRFSGACKDDMGRKVIRLENELSFDRVGCGLGVRVEWVSGKTIHLLGAQSAPSGGRKVHRP